MFTKRIIPCLDIKNGRTVKGVHFENLKDAGDPLQLAKLYSDQGADELVFLDISATKEERETIYTLVKKVGQQINIPFTVGGGISNLLQVEKITKNGADKVSVNSSAVRNPNLIKEISQHFGSQCLVLAIDARRVNEIWKVHTHGGSRETDLELFEWAKRVEDLGAGEILFTSMDHDGTRSGFALEALQYMSELLTIPVIASGGAGKKSHFIDVFKNTSVTAALAAGIFHFGDVSIPDLKQYLNENQVPIRI